MTLSIDQLKQIAKDYIHKDEPALAGVEPTHQAETRVVDRGTQAKLGLSQPHAIAAKVNVFTFKKTVTAEDSAKIPIVTRVTVDGDGNVLKITGN